MIKDLSLENHMVYFVEADERDVYKRQGAGFGKNGEGFFRLTAFGDRERTLEAVKRIKSCLLYTSRCV